MQEDLFKMRWTTKECTKRSFPQTQAKLLSLLILLAYRLNTNWNDIEKNAFKIISTRGPKRGREAK